jgi:hypothetical protein
MPRLQGPDRRAHGDEITSRDGRGHRLIGRTQAARVFDADHAATGQRAGVDDPPRPGRAHDRRRRGRQIDPAMAR